MTTKLEGENKTRKKASKPVTERPHGDQARTVHLIAAEIRGETRGCKGSEKCLL